MKEIILSNNKGITIVDDGDYDMLSEYIWYYLKPGYCQTHIYLNGKRTSITMHRFLLGTYKNKEIDHIDRDKLNNRRDNLRIVTKSQNKINVERRRLGTSKYKGVNFHKVSGKWQARVQKDKKREYLGLFKSENEAAEAYNKEVFKLHGEYAVLNIIEG